MHLQLPLPARFMPSRHQRPRHLPASALHHFSFHIHGRARSLLVLESIVDGVSVFEAVAAKGGRGPDLGAEEDADEEELDGPEGYADAF